MRRVGIGNSWRSSQRAAFGGGFQAVADGVAHQMEQRVHHSFDQVFVYFGVLSVQIQPHLFVRIARQIADNERHSFKDFGDRNHSRAHHAFAQIAQPAFQRQIAFLQRAPGVRRQSGFQPLQLVFQP